MAKTILVADDNKGQRMLLQTRLEAWGYKVDLAQNGEEALSKAHSDKPDLLILDVSMPKMDGDEVYMYLKSEPAFRSIPILILTGLRSEKEIRESHEENMFAKPVNFEELKVRIRALIGE